MRDLEQAAVIDEADHHLGRPATPAPTILPLSDWLGEIARILGADLDPVPRPRNAAPAASPT